MGLLAQGKWQARAKFSNAEGRFVRQDSTFRNWVTADGLAGPTGQAGFKAEAGRYHLYVSLACPWAHRTLIFRRLKNLGDAIDVSIVEPLMLENGWTFSDSLPDSINGARNLYEIYQKADPIYTGRVTVPVLWDKAQKTIVSNESADIIRMFNSAFTAESAGTPDFYPSDLRREIDAVNERVYHAINNGVYKAGFATRQDAYEEAAKALFDALEEMERRLGTQKFLAGDRVTEADWRFFTTLIRFDAVYVGHFKCNWKRIADFPNLSNYLRQLYQVPGIAETVDFQHIKTHYYGSHRMINPNGIVPVGPRLDLAAPHDRGKLVL